jgi:hypothetical protein
VLAERGEAQARVRAPVGRVQQLPEPPLDGLEVEVGTLGQPATEHEHRRVERVREVDEPEGHPAGELVDDRHRRRVALLGGGLDVLAADLRHVAAGDLHDAPQASAHGRRAGELRQPRAGCVPLPAAPAPAGARRTVRVDHHVPELPREPVVPDDEAPTHDDAPADPGPQRHRHDVVVTPSGTDLPLGERRARRVVGDGHRPAEERAEAPGHVEVEHVGHVGRRAQHAVDRDEPGSPDADRPDVPCVVRQHGRDARQHLDELVRVVRRGLARLGDDVVGVVHAVVDDHAEALRATDVDAQATRHRRRSDDPAFRPRRGSSARAPS